MLLINTSVLSVIQIVITSTIGMFAIAGGLEGFMKKKMPWWQRIIAIIGGLGMIDPDIVTDLIGILLILIVVVFQYVIKDKTQQPENA